MRSFLDWLTLNLALQEQQMTMTQFAQAHPHACVLALGGWGRMDRPS